MEKVLIIDDIKNIRTLLTTCLELRGFQVLTAESGKVALDIIKNENGQIGLIFLDIRMPEKNGTEVFKNIRELGINCPVIIMTAFATVKNAIDCTKLGAAAYLQKPFSTERVNAVLDEIYNITERNFKETDSGEDNDVNLIIRVKEVLEEENYTKAHDMLKKALAYNPYNWEIYYLIGIVNERLNDIEKSKMFYEISKLVKFKEF